MLKKVKNRIRGYIQSCMRPVLDVLVNIERIQMCASIPLYRLEHYEHSSFSQHGEDGIINEIFNRIGTSNKIFVEFGAEIGIETNTHLLLASGWTGLWIEGSEKKCQVIKNNFSKKLNEKKLFLENCFITRDNIDAIIKKYFTGEIDLLSVDIDGNDYYVLNAITCIKPRVIVTEYNANFPPPHRMVIDYDPNFVWQGDDYYGVSLQKLVDWADAHGYILVGCDLSGTNAFWVRKDLFSVEKFPYDTDVKALFHPARYYSIGPKGHPASFKWNM